MTQLSSIKGIGLALGCAALCCNAPLRADEQVPFKGSFAFTVLSVTPLDATHVRSDIQVNVHSTLLGKAQGPAYFILDVTDLSYVGATAWTAANGDVIFSTFAGQFVPSGTPGVLNNVETGEIVGGTGRFEGATGPVIGAGQVDAATLLPLGPIPFVGTISSPGSLKH
jgi:hypothetical protein